MKFLGSTLLTGVAAYLLGAVLPWWSVAPVAFVAALIVVQRPLQAFFSGAAGIFLCWTLTAAWLDHANDGILAGRIAHLLPLEGNTLALILLTGLVGALVGGLSALSAGFLTGKPKKHDTQSYYHHRR